MWAVGQYWNVLTPDATVKVARFASCICSCSDEDPTNFICSPHLLHFICALWPLTSTVMIHLRYWHSFQQQVDQKVQHSVPNAGERHLILSTRKYSDERKNTKSMEYVVKHLLPKGGSKNCTLSSAQIERNSVTNWCLVALIEAIAGSTVNWSKRFTEMRNPQGTKPKVYLIWIHHYHLQMPAPTILCSAHDIQIQLCLAPNPIRE